MAISYNVNILCEGPNDCAEGYFEAEPFAAKHLSELNAVARAEASALGWTFGHGRGHPLCPKCSQLKEEKNARKTDRQYGAIMAIIRGHARSHKTFRPSDLPLPRTSATTNCRRLAKLGELTVLERAARGYRSIGTLYAINRKSAKS